MSKTRKIARCLIAFFFAFAFAVNSVFASYSDSAGYYSCLGGGWNFSSTGSVTSPYSASGTYQLSVLNGFSALYGTTRDSQLKLINIASAITGSGRIESDINLMQLDTSLIRRDVDDIFSHTLQIKTDVDLTRGYVADIKGDVNSLNGQASSINTQLNNIYSRQDDFENRFFVSSFSVDDRPNSFASQLLESVLDPTERAIRDASDGAASSLIDDENGYFGSNRRLSTDEAFGSISTIADYANFFGSDASISDFALVFEGPSSNDSLFIFFTERCLQDMNPLIYGYSSSSSSSPSLLKSGVRKLGRSSSDFRTSRIDDANVLINSFLDPSDPRRR